MRDLGDAGSTAGRYSLDIDVLQRKVAHGHCGEDERFQLPMAASGINSATLSDEIFMRGGRLLDVMERPLDARILGKHYSRNSLSCADGTARRGAACTG